MSIALASITPDHRTRFARDGFVALDQPVVSQDEVDEVLALLQPLLDRSHALPADKVHDLGVGDTTGGRILEVDDTTELEPALRRTAAFARCRDIAEDLLGVPVVPFFDHVIAKPPHNLSSTPWHQDAAYSEVFEKPPTTHFWLALQPATEANGCMRFIPGSHLAPLPHGPRGGDASAPGLEALGIDDADAVACPLPSGGVTIHHPGTLHSTGPNTTDEPRVAWILHYREAGALRGLRRRLRRR